MMLRVINNVIALLAVLASWNVLAQKRAITTADCVTTKYLLDGWLDSPLKINSHGTLVVYLVKTPNLTTNRNDIGLYVREISKSPTISARLLLSGTEMSHVEWLKDGRHIVLLVKDGGSVVIAKIDTATGDREILARTPKDIKEYSTDENGTTVVFAVDNDIEDSSEGHTLREIAKGYEIPFSRSAANVSSRGELFVARDVGNGKWTKPEKLTIKSPVTNQRVGAFRYLQALHLSLSPNGRSLLFQYNAGDQIPEEWKKSPFVETLLTRYGFSGQITVLYDLTSGKTTLAMNSLYTLNIPLWSADSRSFLVAAYPPVGSQWWPQQAPGHVVFSDLYDLLWVQPSTGRIELVSSQIPSTQEQPLFWDGDRRLLLYNERGAVEELSHRDGAWHHEASFDIPTPHPLRQARLASDGEHIVGEYQDAITPPELFQYGRGNKSVQVFAKLNPQMDGLELAKVQEVQWNTSTGYSIHGVLFAPPDATPDREYPLVIQTKPYYGQFVCDEGESHYPSFAPQPLAASGIMYLVRGSITPGNWNWNEQDDIAQYPKGYPGDIGEAAFNMDVWESGVEALSQRGIIDANKVGVIGFSRSGWYTEFSLMHSRVRYKAATAADNVEYGLSEYWSMHSSSVARGWDSMYGGPPYGITLKNWLDYSISFNLEKIHTPLLMEEMGSGVSADNDYAIPRNLVNHYDVFVGLNQLKKPVELYYYPNEEHAPDHPQARLASLQRNVDWYRFWLQGYERPDPEDPNQYTRWKHLRGLQDAEDKAVGQPQTSIEKPN